MENRSFFVFVFIICVIIFSVDAGSAPWSVPITQFSIANVTSAPSNSSACPGGIDLIINGVIYPCIGGSGSYPTEESCPEGLMGIKLNSTLVCGTIGKSLLANESSCEFGGFEFISNVLNQTLCYDDPNEQSKFQSLFDSVNATIVDVVALEGSNATLSGAVADLQVAFGSINNRFSNSSSFTFNLGPGPAVSGSVFITASDAAISGGKSLYAGYVGANLILKQLFGIPGFLEYSSTPDGIQLVSLITAYNIPYTGFNPMYFPDCPFITTQSDVNVCLAGRTISSLTNQSNAADVQYFPAMPYRNQTSFSVASGFDAIFEDQSPIFTRVIYVNGQVGDDVVNGGGQFDPFKTIDKAVSVVPTVPFTQFYTILVAIDVYTVGNISFPPNTNLISYNRFKQTRLNFLPGCGITLSPAWALFANDHVEAGISGFTINGGIYIDFRTMGAAGVNSDARFSFSESSILGAIQSMGRGSMDLFHAHNIEMHGGYTGNCNNVHAEYSSALTSITLTDDDCYSSNLTYFVIYNIFNVNSNLTIYQSTSIIHADIFLNGYDDNAWAVFHGNASLFIDTYTIPLNFYADPTVTIKYTFNSQGGRSCGLNVAYFGASCLNNADILIAIRQRARLTSASGFGQVPAVYSTDIANVVLYDFSTSTPNTFSITPFNGSIYFANTQFLLDAIPSTSSFIASGIPNGNWSLKVPVNTSTTSFTCNVGTCQVDIIDPITNSTSGGLACLNFKGQAYCIPSFFAGPSGNMLINTGSVPGNYSIDIVPIPSFTSARLSAISDQLTFGTGITATLNVPTPSTPRRYTVNDPGVNSSFVMTDGDQAINGIKTFFSSPVASTGVGFKANNVANTFATNIIPSPNLAANNAFAVPSNSPTAGTVVMSDGTNSAWTPTSSLKGLTITYCSGVVDKSITTNADTSISPGCGANLNPIIPANTLTAGSTISIEARGIITAAAGTTMNFNLFFNATAISTVIAFPLGTPAGWGFVLLMEATIRTVGVSGTVVAEMEFRASSNAGTTITMISQSTATTVINTALPIAVDPHVKFSVAAGSTWTQKKFFVKGTNV